ncbi:MAG: ABC transporter permease subunit [Micromonosporaceae bacterium]|nr:ABC transporter permease subunit [Micromonosporaceae bacterium]
MFRADVAPGAGNTLLWTVGAALVVAVLVMGAAAGTGRASWATAGKTMIIAPLAAALIAGVFVLEGQSSTFTAIKNNIIWVIVAPAAVTALGLIFAVLTERVRWSTAFKVVVFMPMAISFLAAGVTFKMVYDQNPDRGVANAVAVGVHDTFADPTPYPGARGRPPEQLEGTDATPVKASADVGLESAEAVTPGTPVKMALVGLTPKKVPDTAGTAAASPSGAGLSGVVWLDFVPGSKGENGAVDSNEKGLPGITVEAVRDGKVVDTTQTDASGQFSFPKLTSGSYTVRLPASNFAEAYSGIDWLGPSLATAAIIISYIWIWAGFAMVLIAAGLAAIPRDALEAARVDGATEWQVFQRVTIPLVRPVLVVVFVTLMINVLKIFDLVFVIPPEGPSQESATVIALEMWRVSFGPGGGADQGVGSALAVLLFLVVVPAMLFNIRRFRKEQS